MNMLTVKVAKYDLTGVKSMDELLNPLEDWSGSTTG